MKYSERIGIVLMLALFMAACSPKEEKPIIIEAENFHQSVQQLTNIMVHDIFSPPVASRVYVYPILTAYEILQQGNDEFRSLHGQINDFPKISTIPENIHINLELAALVGLMDVGRKLVFSEDMLTDYRDSLYHSWEDLNPTLFEASRNYGLVVAAEIKEWLNNDNYNESRTMTKYSVDLNEVWRWQPTPPDYMDGIEPHWMKIRTMSIDSASQFKPKPHPNFSMEVGSDFYTELMEVYNIGLKEQAEGDTSYEVEIAKFWDCNPYVSVHRGHMMFAVKKISPGAHWIGICEIACRKENLEILETLAAYTTISVSIFDAFISCWDEKYRSVLIRPETLINKYIDENWVPILQTPPFPEYTSGHSVVSGAAAVALTKYFGDNFYFDDDVELPYGLPVRSFDSFYDASKEAAISRLFGGIHYRAAIDNGLEQGLNLGHFVSDDIQLKSDE